MIKFRDISKITFIYIIIVALFSRYIEHFYIWKILLLFLFFLQIFYKKFRKCLTNLLTNKYLVLSIIILFTSSLISTTNTYFLNNLNLLIWPNLFMILIVCIYLIYPKLIKELIDKSILPLNIMLIINLIVLMIQIYVKPIFIKSSWLNMNPYYPDLCSGLFGYNGTHELTMYILFMNILNIYWIKKSYKNRIHILIYLFVINIITLFTATKNDNIALFILLPLFLVSYFLLIEHFKFKNLNYILFKIIKYVTLILFISIPLLFALPTLRSFIDEFVIIRTRMVLNIWNSNYQVNGSNERLAIVQTSLNNFYGWLFGLGFGTYSYGGGNYLGFEHFGLSSMGSMIATSGIWFFLFYTMYFTKTLTSIFSNNKKFIIVICFFWILGLSFYTIFYTSFVTTIWFSLIFIVLSILKEYIERNIESN